MTRFIIPVVLLIVHTVVLDVAAAPSEIGPAFIESGSGQRLTRATCDLTSFELPGFAIHHALCAAHCLVMGRGFRGGSCINGVCHCRK
ncbi:defensin-like [Homalodisca vitripennis]|uniref:defensin-like n=1 Tax=Homalodisca vitripennis TaxID=197043 RepID=UPI001EE9D351|nr:defensin-like [Homalodisca vitripennis]KAG8325640.1 hypothetical protein J6590_061942 [Homalodisca vitripennis]